VTRRLLALFMTLVLGAALAACGDDSGGSSTSGGGELDGVSIEGDVGKAPTVKWDGKLEADKISSEVLVEGDGEEVQSGDQVLAHVWLGNGTTQEEAYSSYAAQPQALTVDPKQLPPVFIEGMEGHTIGSRVAVKASAAEAFGEFGNPQIGIGNKDTVLLVIDLVEMYVPPKAKDVPADQLPSVVEKKGEPVSLDFSGVPEPKKDGDLLRATLEEGDGKPLTTDMTVTANYLGMVYGAKKPFDESFSKKPVPFQLTQVVEGWTYGLEGVKVGSRVLLQIPPDLGYGAQEQPGIPADSTLYFVVDVVAGK
jgi:peptidylprolyl isomerase